MNYSEIVSDLLSVKFTQQTLADEVHASQSTISRILSGEHQYPRIPTAKKLESLHEIHCTN